ncbi:hybrid sensor histidine kinase/response regulator [Streptomyces sp. NPDC003710]
MTRVLVVEDDPQLVRALVINLQARQYGVDAAPDGATALRLAAARQPDVVLLDLGLPDMDGVDVIKALRGWTRVPILVLSARQASDEKVAALDAGGDDYITKPFSMDELLARLRAAVRRTEDTPLVPETTLVETADFSIDLLAKKAVRDGRDMRVVDRGPGVPDRAKDRIFEPFQRYGDSPRGVGVGLGLAVARGFAEAIGGTLHAEDTPGRGLTMALAVRTAPERRSAPCARHGGAGTPAFGST